ncbi:MAG: AlpA family phage regulatory protein [Nevskiaceae bacterium]|nr:AlpA family phage regulatory protein [Nevskiaceae bacterium]
MKIESLTQPVQAADTPIIDRLPAVRQMVGLSPSSIYKLVAERRFPKPVRLTARAVGWKRAEVLKWIETRGAV